jgi:hypothetical protein
LYSMSLSPLNHLLKATSKTTVEKCLNLSFITRSEDTTSTIKAINTLLEIESLDEASQLHEALLSCIQIALSTGSVDALAELFTTEGADVDPKLKQLVGKTIANSLDDWKEAAAFNRVSLPRLVDFDWTLHLIKASNEVSTINNQQSVVMSLLVEEQQTSARQLPDIRTVDFELSREALETVIDGLGKIRDQLGRMG